MVKVCTKCGQKKPLSGFHKNRQQKSGLSPSCKHCKLETNKLWSEKNKDLKSAYNREYIKGWSKINKDLRASNEAKRRSSKIRATPVWLTKEHLDSINNFYWLAKDLKAVTGDEYHIDHIVPLKGKNICGLHVPWNLQVLPADLNIKKGNRFV